MSTVNIILTAFLAIFAGVNIFQFLSFRAYKKKYESIAEKDTAEAEESKQAALERRLSSMEKLYEEQGTVIDGLRKDILKLSSEKYANDRRIIQLEAENKTLKEKVEQLESDVNAYKTIVRSEK